jgi:Ca2+-transporting ATPase
MNKAKENSMDQQALKELNWHHIETEQVKKLLEVSFEEGLDKKEVEKRLEKYGPNILTPKKKQSKFVRFMLQFHQPLIYILLVATVITFFLNEYLDSAVIFAVVFINAIIGYIQESKALEAIDALARSIDQKSQVIRNGAKTKVDNKELVPGDLVIVQSGDKFPADLRMVHVRDMKVDESALTGESVAVEKNTDPVPEDMVLGDRQCMGYASTVVTSGQGKGCVVATGDHTEIGKIQQSIAEVKDLETPLTKKIKEFSNILLWVILGLCILVFAIGMSRGEDWGDTFMVAVALAVGAIPEGLPVAVTIMLALGVSKMAKRKAIIRKLVAVETLGSTNVICSDKTGTLTENQMTVQQVFAGGKLYQLTGLGYQPEGELQENGNSVDLNQNLSLMHCLKAGGLCNDSAIKEKENLWITEGDPTEGALLVASRKAGYLPNDLSQEHPRLDTIPFESEYQYMATLHGGKQKMIYLKGSVEAMLDRCSEGMGPQGETSKLDKTAIQKQVGNLAGEGLRVLAFAMAEAPDHLKEIDHEDISENLIFLGLQGMIDPPRQEAVEAVKLCQHAGIEVKMITGDHAITASVIAGQIGLKGKMENGQLVSITGRELQKIGDKELEEVAANIAVFARVSPDQKLRLVKALQDQERVVAMTGDGVNDGPALKQANIGIAMGITGTEVAKDASDMVLTDDNFSSIEGAVEEGRGVFDNLTKFIAWTLPTNLGEALIIILAVFLGTNLPVEPVQILWINMTTAVFLGLTLSFEPKEPGIMDRPPRPAGKPILTRPIVLRTLLVGALLLIASFGLFLYELELGATLVEARTVATTVFVVLESAYLLNCRSFSKPMREIGFFTNMWVYYGIAAMFFLQALFIYAPFMNTLFKSSPLDALQLLRIFGAGILLLLIVTVEKYLRIKTGSENHHKN